MMMLPTGWCSLYQTMPPVTLNPYEGEAVPAILESARRAPLPRVLDLTTPTEMSDGIRIIHGIGRDWKVVQLLSPTDAVTHRQCVRCSLPAEPTCQLHLQHSRLRQCLRTVVCGPHLAAF